MKKTPTIILTILASVQVEVQLLKAKSIDISIGLGLSAPYDDIDVVGSGFYLQGETYLNLPSGLT